MQSDTKTKEKNDGAWFTGNPLELALAAACGLGFLKVVRKKGRTLYRTTTGLLTVQHKHPTTLWAAIARNARLLLAIASREFQEVYGTGSSANSPSAQVSRSKMNRTAFFRLAVPFDTTEEDVTEALLRAVGSALATFENTLAMQHPDKPRYLLDGVIGVTHERKKTVSQDAERPA